MELLISLIAGLIIAFALQLLLANLGIALGLTVLDFSHNEKSSSADISLPITHLLGFGVALSLSTVLFATGLLTTEFSQIIAPRRGIIFGIILWASYWLVFVWLCSTTLSNIADSLLGTALGSGRRLVAAICKGAGNSERQITLQQLTEEVSRLSQDQQRLLVEQREALVAEMENLMSRDSTLAEPPVEQKYGELEIASPSTSSSVMSRLNLPSGRQLLERAMDHVPDVNIDTLWQQLSHSSEQQAKQSVIYLDVADYLQQMPPWMLQPKILQETFAERIYDPEASADQIKAQLATIEREHFVDWLQGRGDLAMEQVETVADQLSRIKQAVAAALPSTQPNEAIEQMQDKLIAYCRYTNLDLLTPENLKEKVQSQSMEQGVTKGLDQLDVEAIEAVLSRRQGLEPDKQQSLMAALHSALPKAQGLAPRRWAERSGRSAQHLAQRLTQQVGYYLRYQHKSAFNPTQMVQDLGRLVKTSVGPVVNGLPETVSVSDHLPDALFDKHLWKQELGKRRDMTATEIEQIIASMSSVGQDMLHQISDWADNPLSQFKEALVDHNSALLDAATDKVSAGLSTAQQTIEHRVDAAKTEIQTQAENARGQAAISAWWLFSSLFLSGLSAATSGWLAAIY